MSLVPLRRITVLLCLLSFLPAGPAPAQTAVYTQNNDNARTGANLEETALTPANINSGSFGKLFTITGLNANVNGQVLFAPNVLINGTAHNVIYAYTSNNSNGSPSGLYAFDADTGAQVWTPVIFPASAEYTTPSPVIDPSTDTIYVLTKSTNDTGATFLRAYDITTGLAKGSIQITATVPGTGAGTYTAVFNGKSQPVVSFDGNHGNGTFHTDDRAALLLLNGVVYCAFAFNTDAPPYHGWILGYAFNGTSFTQKYVFCTTPNGSDGGIWMAGKGLTADNSGNIYVTVGNGTFDANTGGSDYGMCYLKLSSSLTVLDYFSPYDELAQSNADNDTGNIGLVGLPGTTKLFGGATKFGAGFLVDSANMGHFTSTTPAAGYDGVNNVVLRLNGLSSNDNVGQNPIVWNMGSVKSIYLWPNGSDVEQLVYNPSTGGFVAASAASNNPGTGQPYPMGVTRHSSGLTGGGSLAVSANNNGGGILWAVSPHDSSNATLYAFNAADVSQAPLYSVAIGSSGHFQFPTVVNGKVYVPTGSSSIVVYGLLAPPTAGPAVNRLYSPYNGDHFYTINAAESNAAVQSGYYNYEGVIGYAPPEGAALGLLPVYRLYYPSTGEHFYTQSAAERDFIAMNYGYLYEFVAFDVMDKPGAQTLPLYRLYSPIYGKHFYTTSQAEHDYLVMNGWNDEGILGYVKNSP